MPNDWFRFKLFTIYQERSAMKVGTDGVLLGAWANVPEKGKILDVGTGTGLIALMMAQRTQLDVYALEPDKNSYSQALENARRSPWADRIQISDSTLQEFAAKSKLKFDLIISNPPFHTETTKSPNTSRSSARNAESLPLKEFFLSAKQMLSPNGTIAIIYPYGQWGMIEKLAAENELFVRRKMSVFPSPGKAFHRVMLQISSKKGKLEEGSIMIENGARHHYSPDYKALTAPFYFDFKY